MTQFQLQYYNSLPLQAQQILQAAAFRASFRVDYSFQQLVYHFTKAQLSQKVITPVIENAVKQELLTATPRWETEYEVSPEFLLFAFKNIEISPKLWEQIASRQNAAYFYSNANITLFRDTVYALIYTPEQYLTFQAKIIQNFTLKMFACFTALIEDEYFDKYLKFIHKDIIRNIAAQMQSNAINQLMPFDELVERVEKIARQSNIPDLQDFIALELSKAFWSGNLEKAIKLNSLIDDFPAIKYLIDGDVKTSLNYFTQRLRKQHKKGNKAALPDQSYIAYFYILALLFAGAEVSTPVFKKAVQQAEKDRNCGFYYMLVAIAYDALGMEKNKLAELQTMLKTNILRNKIDATSVSNILILYLSGGKIEENHAAQLYKILKTAVDAGYLLLAYEAAFAAKQWTGDKDIANLYSQLSEKLNYTPVISRMERQEEWEKSLNLLLGIKNAAAKGKSAVKNAEDGSRVVYYFSPRNKEIQPVLQTRQIKGWSAGRNIAMKTFFNASAKGMSDHDLRIAKTLKFYKGGYYDSDSYEFADEVFSSLIGHPYIFLNGTTDTPVEFVAAQPIVKVKKELNQYYRLSSDLKEYDKKIILKKETNTRYLVYELTPRQQQILQIINEQYIKVPESGKEKLVALLGAFSAEGMTVHSDLVAAENSQVEIREVPADERIRVQLLPFGDGLKAELYVKPFGDRPPYCKPAKGGQALISNEKDVQLQVKRNFDKEKEYETVLLNEIQTLESLNVSDDLMSFEDPLDSLYLLDILRDKQEICVVEWAEGERFRLRGTANFSNLNLKISSGINWFDVQGELKVDDNTVISLQKLLSLTEKGHNRFIEIGEGEFLALSKELKKRLDELRMFSSVEKKEIHLNKFASVALENLFDNANLQADKKWRDFQKNIDKAKQTDTPVPANLQAELRAYQIEGYQWLTRLAAWGAGACLADDMGLGKTVQTLAVLLQRASYGAALVVCPVSVVGNWIAEIAKFAPSLNAKTLPIGTKARKEVLDSLEAGDVLLISYGLLQSEEKLMTELEFATVVLDEAHVIKNYATKTSKATMQLKADFRIALTGTPIQNYLSELWNLFNFINPGLLGSLQHFNDNFVKTGGEQSSKLLKKLIAPFILRRTKTAVLDELPPKTEIVKKIMLSSEELAFYEALRRQALENLELSEAKHIQVLAELTKLRLASCNPALVDAKVGIPSSKMAAFLDIVSELRENKHRALVFSQFVKHLDVIRKELDKQGVKYQYLDGSTPQKQREENVRKFQNGEGELFLISLKAGGLGLNLTAADFVIHLDPWWNPAVEDQASDRAHRIGQQRPVTIYRLVAENTIEEKIIQLHATKRDLADTLLEGSDTAAKLSLTELMELIKER